MKKNKNKVLRDLAALIAANTDEIIKRNKQDLEAAKDLDATLYDRLKVDERKVAGMIKSIEEVLQKADPEGEVISQYTHPNGMRIENRKVPFGKILIIYESRPDVTIEAAISAFKAGNQILLKGGKEARNSNLYLVQLWHQALEANGWNKKQVSYLELDRAATQDLIRSNTHRVDLIIPRGGEGLINFIRSNTEVPILVSGRGNNFVYVHEDADFAMAVAIILDGKTRLSVCNAVDKVLLNRAIPDFEAKTNYLIEKLAGQRMEIHVSSDLAFTNQSINDSESTWYKEFLAAKLLIGSVNHLEEAVEMINKFSGGHSATIITEDHQVAQQFLTNTDCAAVYHNASTRFTDGGQFGFGAEIAISTQKLHFRGPIGLGQLVTNKWFVFGNGQIRN